MIKAIIFDFGNVICTVNNGLFLERISKYTSKTVGKLEGLIYQNPTLPIEYEKGAISSDEFFEKVAQLCELKMDKQTFIEAFTDIFEPIETTFALIRKLKGRYKLGLLSNTSQWDYEYGIKAAEVFGLFEAVSLSFELRAMKPSEKIYRDIVGKLGVAAEECVFIDDCQANVEGARQAGLYGIWYNSYEQLVESLEELGIGV